MSKRIAISIGDFNGIGPEIVLKTLSGLDLAKTTPIILGSEEIVSFYSDLLDLPLSCHVALKSSQLKEGSVNILESYNSVDYTIKPGELTRMGGKCSMLAVERGIKLCLDGKADALVTAPISKEAINLAGYEVPGHTEFLAERTQISDFMMMMVNDGLRIGLSTIHIPLSKVVAHLSEASILRFLQIMSRSLTGDFNIQRPRIAVLGLNPHAGDGGVIGDEEIRMIAPALQKARFNDINVEGPFPADTYFGNRMYERYDGILAMYHDQGLIPFKTLSFGKGVNYTAGLPIIRTSPDHGTAFDIAGQNKANPSSFIQALKLAIELAGNRKQVSVSQHEE